MRSGPQAATAEAAICQNYDMFRASCCDTSGTAGSLRGSATPEHETIFRDAAKRVSGAVIRSLAGRAREPARRPRVSWSRKLVTREKAMRNNAERQQAGIAALASTVARRIAGTPPAGQIRPARQRTGNLEAPTLRKEWRPLGSGHHWLRGVGTGGPVVMTIKRPGSGLVPAFGKKSRRTIQLASLVITSLYWRSGRIAGQGAGAASGACPQGLCAVLHPRHSQNTDR
jgi:hypothetical protein